MQTVVEQQQAYIQAQNAHMAEKDARMAEKDETIAELRKLVGDLQSLKVNLEETLKELRRQLFGTSSEKITSEEKNTQEVTSVETKAKITVKEHTRERKPKAKRDDNPKRRPANKGSEDPAYGMISVGVNTATAK